MFSIWKSIGQGYDGAASFAGKDTGVQKKVLTLSDHACTFIALTSSSRNFLSSMWSFQLYFILKPVTEISLECMLLLISYWHLQ